MPCKSKRTRIIVEKRSAFHPVACLGEISWQIKTRRIRRTTRRKTRRKKAAKRNKRFHAPD
jgi:hypothetical protein